MNTLILLIMFLIFVRKCTYFGFIDRTRGGGGNESSGYYI